MMMLSRRTVLSIVIPGALSGLWLGRSANAALPRVRVGILPFGTSAWEIDVMQRNGLGAAENVAIDVVHFDAVSATQAALLAGNIDIAVLDWLWVMGRRAMGGDWAFSPMSSAAGAVVARQGAAIHSVADLTGMRVGTVDPVDKNWLILQAYAKHQFGIALASTVKLAFATPPQLLKALSAGEIDAMVTTWPLAAKAEARGLEHIIGIEEAVRALGVGGAVPFTGYVFARAWAENNRPAIDGFLAAGHRCRALLGASDAEWQRLRPVLNTDSDAEFEQLKAAYRAGIIHESNDAQHAAIAQFYRKLAEIGGLAMVGASSQVPPEIFW